MEVGRVAAYSSSSTVVSAIPNCTLKWKHFKITLKIRKVYALQFHTGAQGVALTEGFPFYSFFFAFKVVRTPFLCNYFTCVASPISPFPCAPEGH